MLVCRASLHHSYATLDNSLIYDVLTNGDAQKGFHPFEQFLHNQELPHALSVINNSYLMQLSIYIVNNLFNHLHAIQCTNKMTNTDLQQNIQQHIAT